MKPKIDSNGNKRWYLNGKLHRKDGPALEWADGFKGWFLNGKLHRIDGPAIEQANGDKYWYLNDKKITEDFHRKLTQGPLEDLPLYLGLGFDEYISERLS